MAAAVTALRPELTRVRIGSGVGCTEMAQTLTVHHVGSEPTQQEIIARLAELFAGNPMAFSTISEVSVVGGSTKPIKHQPPEYPSAQYQSELALFQRRSWDSGATATASRTPSAPPPTPRLLMGINQHGEGTCPNPRCDERLYGMRQGEGTCYVCGAGLKIYLR